MTDFYAKRGNWIMEVPKLQGLDVLTIHPLDGLTPRIVIETMIAQRILYKRPGQPAFRVIHHGTKIFIQRN